MIKLLFLLPIPWMLISKEKGIKVILLPLFYDKLSDYLK